MERLTKSGAVSQRDIDNLLKLSNENQFGANNAYYKLQQYEDLEEDVESVYGNCPGLLKKVIEVLKKHSVIDEKPVKSRLLTDEDVDKWLEYKQLEEQGRLPKLPCKVGDTVYTISKGKVISLTVKEISIFCMQKENIISTKCQNYDEFRNYVEKDFGVKIFFTKSEAEEKLKEWRNNSFR